jgi:ribulose-5-phosphate 4-epimerase/fuculose-1-phosphate aldolase
MSTALDDVKYQVAVANRILAELGFATGVLASLGHASMRVPSQPDRFVVKGRGYKIDALAAMQPDDMVVCDLEGYKVDGPPGSTQCFEIKMHSCIYKTRPEVQAVVHLHPRFVVVMSILGGELVPMCQEGTQPGSPLHRWALGEQLPLHPHTKTIQTEEEGMDVVRALGNHPAILLQGHGATTVGSNLEEAVMNMAFLEEQARMNWYAYCAAGPNHPRITPEQVQEMVGRPALSDLPHFKDVMAQRGSEPRVGGTWQYYADKVSRDLS